MLWYDGWNTFSWWGMMILMMLFWAIIIGGIVWLISNTLRRTGGAGGETALDILNKRYAKGEINRDEYEKMKREIMTTGMQA